MATAAARAPRSEPTGAAAVSDTVALAAVTYKGLAAPELGCPGDDACALEALVRIAAKRGALLVVLPESALALDAEPVPALGVRPTDSRSAPALARFSALADELDVYLVLNLSTVAGDEYFNTQVAFDPKGVVVARHHKFELFEGERDALTPGRTVDTFDTPFGRVGLLICADMYGDPALHTKLATEMAPDIVAVSSLWTVPGATRWLAAFAHDWKVTVVGANGAAGDGRGGAIVGPDGIVLEESDPSGSRWPIVLTTIPNPRAARSEEGTR